MMKIVYLGSGEFGIASLQSLKDFKGDLVHIFTQPARASGRGQKQNPTPAARWAKVNSVFFTEAEDINSPETIENIKNISPDLIVVIAFGQKIGDQLISLPPKGMINVHSSLLPKYRGAAPVNWALINGETETGVTVLSVVSKMDAGEILAKAKIDISLEDTAESLHKKLGVMASALLLETIQKIDNGSAVYTPQDPSKVTYAPKLKKSDGYIDWSGSAKSILNRIRGVWPWPGAQAIYQSQKTGKSCKVQIAQAELIPRGDSSGGQPGVLDEDLNVICGKDCLKILKLKPAGGGLMDFKSFVNGRSVAKGDVFLAIEE